MPLATRHNWPFQMRRRQFIRAALVTSVMVPSALRAQPVRLTAAVIGHTGRGDYGHGLDTIFIGRSNIQLLAVADEDPAGRVNAAKKLGVTRSYADHREMLKLERPNLVSVAMRQADQHHAIALAALRAGANVYCEKPFVTFPAESDELLREAEKRKLKIAVAHTMRMRPAIRALKQSIVAGELGQLVEMRSYGKQDNRAGGEDMMVLGSHLFDLMRLFAGNPLSCNARVQWQGRDIVRSDKRLVRDNVGPVAGDEVFAQLSFANGINGTFTSSARLRETVGHWGLELYGSKGVARIVCDLVPQVFIRRTMGWKNTGDSEEWRGMPGKDQGTATSHNDAVVDDWLACIGTERESECSGHNGAWAVEMALGIYRAALEKRRITFPLKDRTHPLG